MQRELAVTESQIKVGSCQGQLRPPGGLTLAELIQPLPHGLTIAAGQGGCGTRPDQLAGTLSVPGSNRMIDGFLESFPVCVPVARPAMQIGFKLRLTSVQLRGERLLEERVVAIGAVAVIEVIHRQIRTGELAQDACRPGSLEDLVTDLSGEIVEHR